jgi:2,3-dimethylmalate lyase
MADCSIYNLPSAVTKRPARSPFRSRIRNFPKSADICSAGAWCRLRTWSIRSRSSRDDSNFLIIARTDARTTLGLDEALRRAEAYAKAGADILFIESPESIDEMRTIGRAFDRPLVANMVEGGRTPIADEKTLTELGYSIAIFPAFGFLAAGEALRSAYGYLKEHGSSAEADIPLYKFSEFGELMGFGAVAAFDKAHRR